MLKFIFLLAIVLELISQVFLLYMNDKIFLKRRKANITHYILSITTGVMSIGFVMFYIKQYIVIGFIFCGLGLIVRLLHNLNLIKMDLVYEQNIIKSILYIINGIMIWPLVLVYKILFSGNITINYI